MLCPDIGVEVPEGSFSCGAAAPIGLRLAHRSAGRREKKLVAARRLYHLPMWDFEQPYLKGKLIPPEQAWRRFDDWRAHGTEVGILYVAKSASVSMYGTVQSVRNGRIEVHGTTAGAAFRLKDARFTYGPFSIFPRWPMGPTVEVMALSAYLTDGGWLVLAEGMRPAPQIA